MRLRYPQPANEDDFEIICLHLLRKHWNCPGLQRYGRRGQRQDGVDIVDTGRQYGVRAAQCKHREQFKALMPKEIEEVVRAAKRFSPPLNHFLILTSGKRSTESQDKVVQINSDHRRVGLFTVELLSWPDIEELIDQYPEVAAQLRDSDKGRVEANETGANQRITLEVLEVAFTTEFNGIIVVAELRNSTAHHDQVIDWSLKINDPSAMLQGGPGRPNLLTGAPWWPQTPFDIEARKMTRGAIFFPGQPTFTGSLPYEPIQGKLTAYLFLSAVRERDVEIYSIKALRQKHAVQIVDKWVSVKYPEEAGIGKELREQGYVLYWGSANDESEMIDIKGWEPVLIPQQDGTFARLKIHDHPAIGGYLIFLKKRKA